MTCRMCSKTQDGGRFSNGGLSDNSLMFSVVHDQFDEQCDWEENINRLPFPCDCGIGSFALYNVISVAHSSCMESSSNALNPKIQSSETDSPAFFWEGVFLYNKPRQYMEGTCLLRSYGQVLSNVRVYFLISIDLKLKYCLVQLKQSLKWKRFIPQIGVILNINYSLICYISFVCSVIQKAICLD